MILEFSHKMILESYSISGTITTAVPVADIITNDAAISVVSKSNPIIAFAPNVLA
jgi:hypothetical protein